MTEKIQVPEDSDSPQRTYDLLRSLAKTGV